MLQVNSDWAMSKSRNRQCAQRTRAAGYCSTQAAVRTCAACDTFGQTSTRRRCFYANKQAARKMKQCVPAANATGAEGHSVLRALVPGDLTAVSDCKANFCGELQCNKKDAWPDETGRLRLLRAKLAMQDCMRKWPQAYAALLRTSLGTENDSRMWLEQNAVNGRSAAPRLNAKARCGLCGRAK